MVVFLIKSAPAQMVERTIGTPMIWDAHYDATVMITLMIK